MPRPRPLHPTSRIECTPRPGTPGPGVNGSGPAMGDIGARPTGVLARPEAELRRESNGRESWVFRAWHPAELLGIHADQLGCSLQAAEELRYLLYSPMWEGRGGPFGIRAAPASHAVAVTDRRFIISRDTHLDGAPPTVCSIPFKAVLCIESGTALMLAWTVIHFADTGSARSETVLHRAIGHHHFAAAVRAYRLDSQGDAPANAGPPMAWPETWAEVEAVQAAAFVDRTSSGPYVVALRLLLGCGDTSMNFEVVFPGAALDGIRTALGALVPPPAMRQVT